MKRSRRTGVVNVKIPPTRYPMAIEKQYANDMIKLINQVEQIVLKHYQLIITPQIKNYRADDGELSFIQDILEIIKTLSLNIFSDSATVNIANRFVNNLDLFNMRNITDQASIAGIDIVQDSPKTKDFLKATIKQNVDYIKSIEKESLDKVNKIIYEGTIKGVSSKDIQKQLLDRFGVDRARAKFIAVDQSGSVFGELTKERHTSIGAYNFTWSSVGDSRVRPEHQNYNGKTFSYEDGANGKTPGSDYACRCVGQPVFK